MLHPCLLIPHTFSLHPAPLLYDRDFSPIFFRSQYDESTTAGILHISYYSDRPRDRGMAPDFAERTDLPAYFRDLKFEGGNLLSNGKGLCIMSDRVLYVNYRQAAKRRAFGILGTVVMCVMRELLMRWFC